MLVGHGGKAAIVLHNVGGTSHASAQVVTLDDQAAAAMPDHPDIELSTGASKPCSFSSTIDLVYATCLRDVTAPSLAAFTDDDLYGALRLCAVDDAFPSTGINAFGCRLPITTEVTVASKRKPGKSKTHAATATFQPKCHPQL